jgi:hypothetical protein
MEPYWKILSKIMSDERYVEGVKYGRPRPGHDEGTIAAHIEDLEQNLLRVNTKISGEEFWKLAILVHVHDTFKGSAVKDSPIMDPKSHASLAREFLKEFLDDSDLLDMVQFHDENRALYMQVEDRGKYSQKRLLERVVERIKDIDLYLIFTIIDGYTPSKEHKMLRWFVDQVNLHRATPRVYEILGVFGI